MRERMKQGRLPYSLRENLGHTFGACFGRHVPTYFGSQASCEVVPLNRDKLSLFTHPPSAGLVRLPYQTSFVISFSVLTHPETAIVDRRDAEP